MTDSTSDNSLIFHFPMDEIIGDNVLNYSTAESSGTLDGSSVAADSTTALYATVNDAALIPDDIFGSCLQFASEGENVELESTSMEAPLIQGLEKLTLSFWAFVGDTSPADGSVINAYYIDRTVVPEPTVQQIMTIKLPSENGMIRWQCGNSDAIEKAVDVADLKGKWTHWAFTKDSVSGAMQIYFNGNLWHEESGKQTSIDQINKVTIASGSDLASTWHGKLAHFNVQQEVLAGSEIKTLMLSEKSAQAAFRTTYPLDFSIEDQGQPNVLYISEGDTQNTIDVTVENVSDQPILFEKLDTTTSDQYNYHLVGYLLGICVVPSSAQIHLRIRIHPGDLPLARACLNK